MTQKQQIFALFFCCALFIFFIDMLRRRKLREEYSILWFLTFAFMFLLVLKYDWLVLLTDFIGAKMPTTTLFFFSLAFLMLISIQFSIKISNLTNKLKNLVQENAMMRYSIDKLEAEKEKNE